MYWARFRVATFRIIDRSKILTLLLLRDVWIDIDLVCTHRSVTGICFIVSVACADASIKAKFWFSCLCKWSRSRVMCSAVQFKNNANGKQHTKGTLLHKNECKTSVLDLSNLIRQACVFVFARAAPRFFDGARAAHYTTVSQCLSFV